jgi:hypothetical protein
MPSIKYLMLRSAPPERVSKDAEPHRHAFFRILLVMKTRGTVS